METEEKFNAVAKKGAMAVGKEKGLVEDVGVDEGLDPAKLEISRQITSGGSL